MKKSLVVKSLIAILLVFILGFATVSCTLIGEIIDKFDDNVTDDNNNGDGNNDGGETDDKNDGVMANKADLEKEIALEISEQGDYTEESYNNYAAKLAEAKAVAEDAEATQEAVDAAAKALTEARLALSVRPVYEVEGAEKSFRLISGGSKEIAIADYVNVNGLSKITYEVQTSNAVVTLSGGADGKFTVTAGEVVEATDVTVTVTILYDGEEKLEVELSVHITNDKAPVLKSEEIVKELDIFDLADKESLVLDFAENVDNAGNLALTYSVKLGEADIALDGATYTVALGGYTDEYAYQVFTVTVSYTANGEEGTLEYTYTLGLKDTSAYRVANGDFENGLEGWVLNNTVGEKPFAGIDDRSTFWNEGYPMFNVGKYFSSYAEGAEEASQGTLTSPYFTVNSEYATYMLGGAGNQNVYITIENEAGEVVALYRNTKFADLPAGDYTLEEKYAMIGDTVFLANFVTYKVDIAKFDGQKIRFVIHDHASSGWGVVYFDELNTYYASAELLPENAILAEDLLADKSELKSELALKIAEQGDYTLDSYNAYVAKLNAAQALLDDIAVTQANVDEVTAALTAARLALAVRPIEEVAGANKAYKLILGNSLTFNVADFVNTNELSNITYAAKVGDIDVAVTDGSFAVTADQVGDVSVYITVSYNGEEKLTVTLTVTVTNDVAPSVFNEEVVREYDLYTLENKTDITINFADNIDNAGMLELSYTVKQGEEVLTLDGASYTFAFGTYTDEFAYAEFAVTVSYVANGEEGTVEYTYKLGLKDTTAYRLANGDFESGLDGWTQIGNIGGVSSDKTYWTEQIEFGMDGENMFSAYVTGAEESAVGTLTSSTFTVGGSNFVTFKIGAMRDGNYVYVDVVDAETKQILARYYNGLWTDTDLSGCKLVAYKADLSAFEGKEVFFRISDNADSGYGLFFADSFVTYYESEPDGFNDATPVEYTVSGTIYDVFNGGFEMGNVQGWWNIGEIGLVTNADGYWGDNISYGKDGIYLFTGVESYGADTMREGNIGSLTSSIFEIGGSGWISFMLGGGGNELCYVQVIDASTGEVLARYRQQAQQDAKLIQYVADLSAYIGRSARIQVVDYASSGWGCVSFDNVVTYYASTETLPLGETANNIFHGNYTVTNGSFESGNLDGWTQNITEPGGQNTLGYVLDSEIDAGWYTKNDDRKDGSYLVTFATPADVNCENTMGTLDSSIFTLKHDSYVSFRFGGAGTRDVYIQLVRADGTVIATFYNEAEGKANTEMYAYYYQYTGETADCYFRVVDNATSNYGCFVVDDFRANLDEAPEGFIAAIQ